MRCPMCGGAVRTIDLHEGDKRNCRHCGATLVLLRDFGRGEHPEGRLEEAKP